MTPTLMCLLFAYAIPALLLGWAVLRAADKIVGGMVRTNVRLDNITSQVSWFNGRFSDIANGFEKIVDKACPKPPQAPSLEEKVDKNQAELRAFEDRVFHVLKEWETRNATKVKMAVAAEEIKAGGAVVEVKPEMPAELKLSLDALAQGLQTLSSATQANSEALGFLINFVKKANPKASAEAAG